MLLQATAEAIQPHHTGHREVQMVGVSSADRRVAVKEEQARSEKENTARYLADIWRTGHIRQGYAPASDHQASTGRNPVTSR